MTQSRRLLSACLSALFLALVLALALAPAGAEAQTDDPVSQGKPLEKRQVRVQVLEGRLEPGRGDFYELQGLEPGDMLYVYAARTTGNLDPIIALSDLEYNGQLLRDAFWGQIGVAIEEGADPVEALPEIYDSLFVTWDDDSGEGYDATFAFEVPEEGAYQLLITRSPASLADTFGRYELTIGVNEPAVRSGEAEPTGDLIAVHDREGSEVGQAVQVIRGTLTQEKARETLVLVDLKQGDVLNVYADSPAGDLKPVLYLEDYGGKAVASGNLGGQDDTALLTHVFAQDVEGYKLSISGYTDTQVSPEGEYRAVLTVNAPKEAVPGAINRGRSIVKEPIQVGVGITLQQITDVDQVSENFGAVAELDMAWADPALAFSPDSCNCLDQVYTGDSFSKYAEGAEIDWPQFTIFNQQGNRWTQNKNALVEHTGQAYYQERFTTDFQAPDFNFEKFPFDSQTLYMRVHLLYPDDMFVFTDDEVPSAIGEQLGEEEWYVIDSSTELTTSEDGRSQFAFRFVVQRYLQFYIFRIFVPIVLIIIVSWFSFFLKDYGKRVDVAGANLLVFVAFNFTVSGELPRLGYLTFMDAVLIGVFVISAVVVVFNVFLKRLEMAGKGEQAARIDRFSIWIYPLAYGIGAVVAYWLFLA